MSNRIALLAAIVLTLMPAVGLFAASSDNEVHDSHDHEKSTTIDEQQLAGAGVETAFVGSATLRFTDSLFGVVAAPVDSVYRINAPYPGLVDQVFVQVGDRVRKGQRLLRLVNTNTLQPYNVDSPTDGEVTERSVNQGDRADSRVLLEIADLSTVWVEMSAFPESIEKLAVGQAVTVRDLHHHEAAAGDIVYVAPLMTGGHIARTRAAINNEGGHWRPGMHIKAEVQTGSREVDLAIETAALQIIEGATVVFVKSGNEFSAQTVALGERAGGLVEVTAGLEAGMEYVVGNSFLIKADLLKGGATHDH